MIFDIIWHANAEITFNEEASFILKIWNENEVLKFHDLVVKNLDRLSINPLIGVYNNDLKIYSLMLSKQTILFYNFNTANKLIELYLFWNNSKNSKNLIHLL